MKPVHWVWYSTLFVKSICSLQSRKFCSRATGYSTRLCYLQLGFSLSCYTQHLLSSCITNRKTSNMARSNDYAQHNVCCLKDLGGHKEQMDVIVAGQRHEAKEHVIFFGGDVQDYPENMESHRDNGKYVYWNSLSTAGRLCERFPSAMILVIKPHHMHLKTFSVYSQFVQSNDFGCPTHTPDFGAWEALVSVYEEALRMVIGPVREKESSSDHQSSTGVNSKPDDAADSGKPNSDSGDSERKDSHATQSVATPIDGSKVSHMPKVPLHLIGFSKGCIVLNQLLHELETVENNEKVQRYISEIKSMTWLDGGHSGGSNTWVTDPDALKRLAALHIDIYVHVTPYQVKDMMRRWIGKEKRRFVELLLKDGAKVTDSLHFEDEPKSIENHFRVLEVF